MSEYNFIRERERQTETETERDWFGDFTAPSSVHGQFRTKKKEN